MLIVENYRNRRMYYIIRVITGIIGWIYRTITNANFFKQRDKDPVEYNYYYCYYDDEGKKMMMVQGEVCGCMYIICAC